MLGFNEENIPLNLACHTVITELHVCYPLRTNNTYRDTTQTTNTQLRSKIVLMRSISFHQLKSQKCELIDNHHHFISTYNHNNLGAAII